MLDYPKDNFKILAKTFQGLEHVLANELRDLGAKKVEIKKRAVEFYGDYELLYKANIYLRTALSIIVPIASFNARSPEELYRKALKFNWNKLLNPKMTFSIDGVVHSKFFSHSKYASLKLKDAIIDKFMSLMNIRPSIDVKRPDVKINLHINQDQCTISLDSSGDSLFKRGYRKRSTEAPLNEVLAAGMVLMSDWDKKSCFIDPMCGSGTILIEAVLIANNIPPGIFRKRFGFETWKNFDKELYQKIFQDIDKDLDVDLKFIGGDILEEAIQIAKENARSAGLKRIIDLKVSPIEDYHVPEKIEKGIVITNPPYGERLKKEDINEFYKSLGDLFKNRYKGFSIWVLSNNKDAFKNLGLHPNKKITLFNGPLECKYLKYEIYSGSRKRKYAE